MFLFACKSGVPKDIIQPAQMEKVLFDVHIADGYISSLTLQDTAKIVASSYYNGIYKKFNIDSAAFNKSMNYYYNHIDLLDKMYINIQKSIEIEKAKADKLALEEAKKSLAVKTDFQALSKQPTNLTGKVIQANPFVLITY